MKKLAVFFFILLSTTLFAEDNPFLGEPWIIVSASPYYLAKDMNYWVLLATQEYIFNADGTYELRYPKKDKTPPYPVWIDEYSISPVSGENEFMILVLGDDAYFYYVLSSERILLLKCTDDMSDDIAFFLRGEEISKVLKEKQSRY